MSEEKPWDVDEALISELGNEERDPMSYYLECMRLIEYWCTLPESRNLRATDDATMDAHFLGTVGKALFFAGDSSSPGLRRELVRFAENPTDLIGNYYLFYIASVLGAANYSIEFLPEESAGAVKMPDIKATKSGISIFIEANAKQPARVVDTSTQIRDAINAITVEKQQKFTESRFSPGMIVADISTMYHLANETGERPVLELLQDRMEPLKNGGFLYKLYDDPDWQLRPYNQGNVFAYLIEEFHAIDRARYHVDQCLISMTRWVLRDASYIAFPKASLLVVTKDAQDHALAELARAIYVV